MILSVSSLSPDLSMRMASVRRSFSSHVTLSSAMIFSVSCEVEVDKWLTVAQSHSPPRYHRITHTHKRAHTHASTHTSHTHTAHTHARTHTTHTHKHTQTHKLTHTYIFRTGRLIIIIVHNISTASLLQKVQLKVLYISSFKISTLGENNYIQHGSK